jgi:hypothetical protein
MNINSLLEAEAVIQSGSRPAGAGHGVGGIAWSPPPRLRPHRSGLLHVVDGEQLSPGLLSEVSSGFSVSHW